MHRLLFYATAACLIALVSVGALIGRSPRSGSADGSTTAFAAPVAANNNGNSGNDNFDDAGDPNGNFDNFNDNNHDNDNGDHDNDNGGNDNDGSRNENDDGTNQNDDGGGHAPRPRHEPRPSPPPPAPRPSGPPAVVGPCQFQQGFKTLHDILDNPAFGAFVGTCTDNEFVDYATGNTLQPTTGGLFVYDPARNLATFTNGGLTWINSPWGILVRPNSVRYCFEVIAGPCI